MVEAGETILLGADEDELNLGYEHRESMVLKNTASMNQKACECESTTRLVV